MCNSVKCSIFIHIDKKETLYNNMITTMKVFFDFLNSTNLHVFFLYKLLKGACY